MRVVGEEEVVDLVGAAGEAARAEPRGEGVGAVGVAGCPVVPGGGSQDRGRVARGAAAAVDAVAAEVAGSAAEVIRPGYPRDLARSARGRGTPASPDAPPRIA